MPPGARRILILGGYGNFGGRLATLLQDQADLTLLVAGRSEAKAKAFCRKRGTTAAALLPTVFDRDASVDEQMIKLAPDIVVDASGPFQAYGPKPYRLVEACIARRVHYLDLADAPDFVAGIAAYDHAAAAAGILVRSGVSTFPLLPALVTRALTADWRAVERISAGLAPSPFAGIGATLVRAVASSAGKEVKTRRAENTATAYAFTDTRRTTIAPPGCLPLKNRLFALIDVPDHQILPIEWPELRETWIAVGTQPEILFKLLIAGAWLVRLGLLPSLLPFHKVILCVMRALSWGERRSGMFVELRGRDGRNRPTGRAWHLVAEDGEGPMIPAMGAAALIGKLLAGAQLVPGASTAVKDLDLEDYRPFFCERAIIAGVRDAPGDDHLPLQQQILGSAWDRLPSPLREMHQVSGRAEAEGRAAVIRGRGPLAWLIGRLLRFPNTGEDVPLRVSFQAKDGRETWTRDFAGNRFSSLQYAGRGRWQRLLVERFGPLAFAMALVLEEDGRLRLVMRHWRAFGLPLPLWLGPRSEAFESAEKGRFNFSVEISHPLIGRIIAYKGWLKRLS